MDNGAVMRLTMEGVPLAENQQRALEVVWALLDGVILPDEAVDALIGRAADPIGLVERIMEGGTEDG